MKIVMTTAIAAIALAAAVASTSSAYAESRDRALGEAIAVRDCAGCHGLGNAKGVIIQGTHVPSFSEIANRPHQSRERLQALITMPRHPMTSPPLGDRELRQLAEYILSFRAH